MRWLGLAIVAVLAFHGTARAEPQAPSFQVIVHPDNPLDSADRKLVSDLFLRRRTQWPDNEGVRPVDLATDSPVRARFSHVVHGRTVPQIRSYWQQRIFTGRELPPVELGSDQEVVKFVAANRNAIGYVSAQADTSAVKVLQVKGP